MTDTGIGQIRKLRDEFDAQSRYRWQDVPFGYIGWLEECIAELEKERDELKSELSITKMTLKFMETKP